MNRTFLVIAAAYGFLAVALGAFGAHALDAHFTANPALEPTYETAVRYQMFHVVGLLVVAYLHGNDPARLSATAGWLFTLGILLFSGSLYILAAFDVPIMGAVAPLGGLCFLTGWVLVGVRGWRSAKR
ncbi:MAG: DUF423 domain-containing protein [Chloroflexota bacterium]